MRSLDQSGHPLCTWAVGSRSPIQLQSGSDSSGMAPWKKVCVLIRSRKWEGKYWVSNILIFLVAGDLIFFKSGLLIYDLHTIKLSSLNAKTQVSETSVLRLKSLLPFVFYRIQGASSKPYHTSPHSQIMLLRFPRMKASVIWKRPRHSVLERYSSLKTYLQVWIDLKYGLSPPHVSYQPGATSAVDKEREQDGN